MATTARAAERPTPAAFARRPVLMVAGAAGLLLAVFSGRYGYHRDELYFRVAGRHPDWGYPDQPPLVPLLARGITEVFGDSLVLLRLPSALAVAAGVVVAALTARELGGGRRAQLMTAGAFAVCPFFLAVGHLLSTATFDLLSSAVLVWLAVRWVRTRDQRLLLVIGAVAGLASNVKYLAGFLLGALVCGLLAVGPRDFLRRPMTYAGAAVAVAAMLPGLLWQARHGWPQLEMSERIAAEGDFGGRVGFLPFQLILTGVVLSWLWLYGLWRLFRSPELAPFRFLGCAYLLSCGVFLLTAGKPYYLAGLWPALWAAGAVEVERRSAPRGWAWAVSPPAYAITAVVAAALTLPVYSVSVLADTPQPAINADAAETVGWPRLVAEAARVHRSLPPAERARAVVFTVNYGQAGALDRYGPRFGLPRPYSGHNGYWHFGRPPETGGPVIVVGGEAPLLRRHWSEVTMAGRVDNGVGLDNDEQGTPVWICRGQREPWAVLWPRLKHLD
ncbi:glycosyltransferase family 39 protein [Thermomonospora catenispora]|uniref:glycosyltransferase family 39 protein n=1 Tax=Thermomonospora catenispora TaxID=2493090 RepID=UPI0019D61E02|nr:glycosyltransferase family 39 protein [Thermomonospora catenispora]